MPLSEQVAHFADVPLQIEMELDRTKMLVGDILKLQPGSVVWLTRSAGENIDLYCGGALLAFGEIVVIENKIGVRITDFNSE